MPNIYTSIENKISQKLTFFAIPKAFEGHIGIIQYNAIASWTLLSPRPEIILYGDEPGITEICQQLDLIHVAQIKRNEYHTPLLDGIFRDVGDRSQGEIIAYLNADIILQQDFLTSVQSVAQQLSDYLLIGRRWNLDLDTPLAFELNWQSDLNRLIKEKGSLADRDCKDYFVFPKHLFSQIPAFAVGRGYWDTWMVRTALTDGIPVVDGSLAITAIHQNHPYTHIRGGRNEAYMGKEAQLNQDLGKITQPGHIGCANWLLKPWEAQGTPMVTAIVVVEDHCPNLEKTLLSVLTQRDLDWEIIVVSPAGDEPTQAVLQSYPQQISHFPLNEQESNPYLYGLTMAQGELVFFLDGGKVLLPGMLAQQIACFASEASTLDILLSGVRTINPETTREYEPWQNLSNLDNIYVESPEVLDSLLSQSAILFRRSRWQFLNNKQQNLRGKETVIAGIKKLISLTNCRVDFLKLITQVDWL